MFSGRLSRRGDLVNTPYGWLWKGCVVGKRYDKWYMQVYLEAKLQKMKVKDYANSLRS
jgi:hypothetical protein